MRLLRLLLMLLLLPLVAGVPAASARPVAAPDCDESVRTPLAEKLEAADAVFLGRVDVVFPELRSVIFEVDVTEVHKEAEGVDWGPQVAVRTPRGDCRLTGVLRDSDWLFVGRVDAQGRVVVTSVGGSAELTPALERRVASLMAEKKPATPAPQLERVATTDPPTFWPMALPGVVLVGLGLLVWLLARLLGRPKEH